MHFAGLRIAALLLAASLPLAGASYTVTDLGALGGSTSDAYGINAAGQVVGAATVTGNTAFAPVQFSTVKNVDLGNFGGSLNQANAINSAGVIVGACTLPGDMNTRAFVYLGGTLVSLGTLGGTDSRAYGINDNGQITGSSRVSGGALHAFRYQNGTMTDLGGSSAIGYAINAAGHVVGESAFKAFIATGASVVSIGALQAGTTSAAYGINDNDQIVGTSNLSNAGVIFHAFLYQSGQMTDIGALGSGTIARAYAINNSSQIVGESNLAPGGVLFHAFLYERGHMTDLNDLLPANSGWVLNTARAINTKGEIAGSGTLNGQRRAFFLAPATPTPTPGPGSEPPRVYLNGAHRVRTDKTRIKVEGSSGGDVRSIQYQIGGKGAPRPARGNVSGWKFSLPLRAKRTLVTIYAVSSTGKKSWPAKLTVICTKF